MSSSASDSSFDDGVSELTHRFTQIGQAPPEGDLHLPTVTAQQARRQAFRLPLEQSDAFGLPGDDGQRLLRRLANDVSELRLSNLALERRLNSTERQLRSTEGRLTSVQADLDELREHSNAHYETVITAVQSSRELTANMAATAQEMLENAVPSGDFLSVRDRVERLEAQYEDTARSMSAMTVSATAPSQELDRMRRSHGTDVKSVQDRVRTIEQAQRDLVDDVSRHVTSTQHDLRRFEREMDLDNGSICQHCREEGGDRVRSCDYDYGAKRPCCNCISEAKDDEAAQYLCYWTACAHQTRIARIENEQTRLVQDLDDFKSSAGSNTRRRHRRGG